MRLRLHCCIFAVYLALINGLQCPSRSNSRSWNLFAKGFGGGGKKDVGTVTTRSSSVPWTVPRDPLLEKSLAEFDGKGLESLLNPKHLTPEASEQISKKMQAGDVVVLRDAFLPDFAEATWRELAATSAPWNLNEDYFDDGYAFHHHNVYDQSRWSTRLNATASAFRTEGAKAWMAQHSGRDCSGPVTGAPSLYKIGDHSLPHTDWAGQRTVAYVWHLSKDWRPEWGGGLYWAQYPHARATFPASFNTLVLFGVTTKSAHFVTTVSPRATSQRLCYNGWFQSSWVPRATDDFEAKLSTPELRGTVTHTQLQSLTDMLSDKWAKFPPGKRERLEELTKLTTSEFFPAEPV